MEGETPAHLSFATFAHFYVLLDLLHIKHVNSSEAHPFIDALHKYNTFLLGTRSTQHHESQNAHMYLITTTKTHDCKIIVSRRAVVA